MVRPSADLRATDVAPARAPLVLVALILVAAVANLNLAVANVALPDIGTALDASQTGLNLIAVSYSLGLAASVLWLGALGDHHGRKLMLILGVSLSVPACLLAAWARSVEVLILARLLGGLAAGMAYPTTLALITVLWSGAGRTKSIALWSGAGGAISALGPLAAGLLLEHWWWGSAFLLTLPLAAVALALAVALVPAHVHEEPASVDNNLVTLPDAGARITLLVVVGVAAGIAFTIRQRRAANPLYDLHVAGRRLFWVAACAGIIVFGSLMAALFIGQLFLQNVLGYSTVAAGAAILPAALFLIVAAPLSARLVESHGARFTLLSGYAFCLLGFVTMLLLWREGSHYWEIALGYAFMGIGVGLAGTPASHSLTGSVPVRRAGMASGTADLQRDLGGAIMQSILGLLLTAGYAHAANQLIASNPNGDQVTTEVKSELTRSFGSATQTAARYPAYADQIIAGAKESFVHGKNWAYVAGIVAVLLGGTLVTCFYPSRDGELSLFAAYQAADDAGLAAPSKAI
jgi:MFS family permease